MTRQKAIEILSEMQLWRRGEGKYDTDEHTEMPYPPKEFGLAIDFAVGFMVSHCE